MLESIKDTFNESIQLQIASAESLSESVMHAAQGMVSSLLNGNKILCCGNGGALANAQHFASSLLNRFETDRPSLPAMVLGAEISSLTAIANDHDFTEIFARQVRAFGQAGDVLLVISTSGNSANLLKAMEAAMSRDMTVIALTGQDGGNVARLLGDNDVEIRIESYKTVRIHEIQLVTLHCLCDLIDQVLFPTHEG